MLLKFDTVDFIMALFNTFRQMSVKTKIAVVLIAVFAISAVVQFAFFRSSLPFGPAAPSKLQQWKSQLGKFSIGYPEDWIAFELPQGNHGDKEVVAFLVPKNNNFPQVLISKKQFPTAEMNEVTSWGETRDQQRGKYESINLENAGTANINGQIREYTIILDSLLGAKTVHCLDLYTLRDEIGYQFAFCAYQNDWAKMNSVFQEMIQSVVFSP